MSKIGLIDTDSHNFPNLPLMKLSAYHKSIGDSVEMTMPLYHYDKVYVSKIFTFTPDIGYIPQADEVVYGGTGYDLQNRLPPEVEGIYPDYSLYPQFDEAYGFLTRGCPRQCKFCIVSEKEGCTSRQVADLSDFWRGQKTIKLLDANLLACKDRERLLQQLIDSRAWVDITQGLDARYMTDSIAKLICQMKISIVHFAFDFMENKRSVVRGLELFRKHFKKSDRYCKVYILTNYSTTYWEDWDRVKTVIGLGYQPYIMIYDKGSHGRFLTDLARWANSSFLYRSCAFEDYVPRSDNRKCGELYRNILNAI